MGGGWGEVGMGWKGGQWRKNRTSEIFSIIKKLKKRETGMIITITSLKRIWFLNWKLNVAKWLLSTTNWIFLSYYIFRKKKSISSHHLSLAWDWHLSSQARGMIPTFTDSSNIFAGALNLIFLQGHYICKIECILQ